MRILILLLMLISCSAPTPLSDNLNSVGGKAAKSLERRFPLKYGGIGRIVQDGKITLCDITFHYKKPMSIKEARSFILNTVETTLDIFQHDQQFQVCLDNKPFGIRNLAIFIFTDLFDYLDTTPELFTAVAFVQGNIRYKQYDHQTGTFKTIYEETYEEAMQKCAL